MNPLREVRNPWISTGPAPVHALPELGHSEPEELVRAVEAAAAGVEDSALRPVAQRDTGVVMQARALLGLLTFWYTRQVYGSAEIVAKLHQDPAAFRFSCESSPDAPTLRRFRAINREALHTCLTSVLRFLAEEKMLRGVVTHVSESHLAEEANRRLIMAMFTDSLQSDKEFPNQVEPEPCFIVAKE